MGHRRPGDRLLRVKVAQELGEVLREARGTPRLRRHGEVSDVKHPLVAIALAIGMVLTGVLVFATGARAHEQETSVDWEVAYANIRVLAPPVYTHYTTQTLPLGGTRFAYSGVISSSGAYPTIPTSPGPVFEPLQGVSVAPFGNLQLIAPWPWAVASLFGQIVIGFAFIGIMWWYARYEKKRGARA